jgi:hypothetical protein
MDVREFTEASAAEFSAALREWLSIPSVSAGYLKKASLRDYLNSNIPNGLVVTLHPGHGVRPRRSPVDSPAVAAACSCAELVVAGTGRR